MANAILGTRAGVYRLTDRVLEPLGLDNLQISAVHAWQDLDGTTVILAGSYGDGLFRSEDDGAHWTAVSEGLTAPAFRTIVPDPIEPGAILSGTEPGRIYRSRDGGMTWEELAGIRALPGHEDWYLPYSPRAGAVRGIYSPGGRRLLAAVEVGGLLDSHDGGESWSYLPVLTDSDLHHITGHPDDSDLLFASLGWAPLKGEERGPDAPPLGGVARSRDGGRTWNKFYSDYTRATIIPPSRPDLLLAGPAKEVGAQGRIEVSADQGETWQPAEDGIEMPMSDMVELFLAAPDGSIWAICSRGRLFRAETPPSGGGGLGGVIGEWQWRSPLPADTSVEVESVAFLPV